MLGDLSPSWTGPGICFSGWCSGIEAGRCWFFHIAEKVFFYKGWCKSKYTNAGKWERFAFFIGEVKNWFLEVRLQKSPSHFWLICVIIVEEKVNVVNALLLGIGVLIMDWSHSFFKTKWRNLRVLKHSIIQTCHFPSRVKAVSKWTSQSHFFLKTINK